jgi:hypothetical protein
MFKREEMVFVFKEMKYVLEKNGFFFIKSLNILFYTTIFFINFLYYPVKMPS